MMVFLSQEWKKIIGDEFAKPYGKKLLKSVATEYATFLVYPPQKLIFNALNQTAFEAVRVVIVGQDPYHGPDQAHGLAFSVLDGQKIPPSLRNIYREIASNIGTKAPLSGDLSRWATQGVLLLNSTLTVRGGYAASHRNLGWEQFTDALISKISDEKEHVVFILWGKKAEIKGALVDHSKHLVLTAAHPSPLSAHHGFFGSKHFSQCNAYLQKNGEKKIIW